MAQWEYLSVSKNRHCEFSEITNRNLSDHDLANRSMASAAVMYKVYSETVQEISSRRRDESAGEKVRKKE